MHHCGLAFLFPARALLQVVQAKTHPSEPHPPMERQREIMLQILRFVVHHPPHPPRGDLEERRLRDTMHADSQYQIVLQQWGEYMRRKAMRIAHQRVCLFQRAGVFTQKMCFSDMKAWHLTPFKASGPQPSMQSALDAISSKSLALFCWAPPMGQAMVP